MNSIYCWVLDSHHSCARQRGFSVYHKENVRGRRKFCLPVVYISHTDND